MLNLRLKFINIRFVLGGVVIGLFLKDSKDIM